MSQPKKKLDIHPEIQIAVLSGSGPAMLMIESVVKTQRHQITFFSEIEKLQEWIKSNIPALVILPMTLREDLLRVVPIVRTAMKMNSYSQVKFLAISDLEQKLGDVPAARNTIRMLQGLMDFVPLKFSGDDLGRKIDEQLNEFQQELSQLPVENGFFFLRGKESVKTFEDIVQAYDQGLGIISRMIEASECALLTLDPVTQNYTVVRSTNEAHASGEWDVKAPNIIPRRDIISNKGYCYFQPIRKFVISEAGEPSYGFIYVLREKAKLPLNTDQASLVFSLSREIEDVSQVYTDLHPAP